MTEFRSRILQSKQYESSLIATSRKRKLRELYAVADCDGPVPLNWVVLDVDQPPLPPPTPSTAEAVFLEQNDILQHRLFDESSLPSRRQLRYHTGKGDFPGRKGTDSQVTDASRLSSKVIREDGTRKSRGITPAKESKAVFAKLSPTPVEGTRRGRSGGNLADGVTKAASRAVPKILEVDLVSDAEVAVDDDVDDTAPGSTRHLPSSRQPNSHVEIFEEDRIETRVESRSGSPGVDPRKAIPIFAGDAAKLAEPLVNGAQDEQHHALTAHLPPPEVQEDHLRAAEERQKNKEDLSGGLTLKLPPPHLGRSAGDLLSSPGSTVEANSATTPAIHDASTDTSPDNESSRYDVDTSNDKNADPATPPELAPSDEEIHVKEEHDKLLKAQIDIARAEILGSSPADADAQLRLEDQQAAAASSSEADQEIPDSEKSVIVSSQDVPMANTRGSPSDSAAMTQSAGELVQDIMEDEDDEVVGVPTPEDDNAPAADSVSKIPHGAEPMDVDSSVVDHEAKDEMPLDTAMLHQASGNAKDTEDHSEDPTKSQKDVLSSSALASTTRRTASTTVPTPPTLERMTTRVSSGAMRHKSVSEILGEIPKPNNASNTERSALPKSSTDVESTTESNPQSRSATPQSPASRMRSLVERAKEKERSKLSTVIFAKKQPEKQSKASTSVPPNAKPQDSESADYFMPLILSQAYNSIRGVQSLENLLLQARKTLTTSNAYVPFHEHQAHKVLRRIHTLQSQDKWSLRQPKRAPEPNRPTAHWDELLKEAKWMRTDFREERKWKMAVARNLARACAEWAEADVADRKLLQVKAALPPRGSGEMNKNPSPSAPELGHPIPEHLASLDGESPADDFDEEPRASMLDAVAPTALFSLGDDDVIFGLKRSPSGDKLLEELPMYGSPLRVHQSDLPTSEVDPDASWRKPALPLSKYVEGKIVLKSEGPPRKRSRYEYEQEDDEDEQVVFGSQGSRRENLEPALPDVALFNPQNKHIRDRLHAGHQFRPPSENPMPLQNFFECRSPSHWTRAEDDELKGLVREYSYNWQLISSMTSTRSLFASSAERRTPWECFERWIYLEGLPADMQKTHYFRAYNNRLGAAIRDVRDQAAQPPPQTNAAGAAITPIRRRTTISVSVERKRNQKHLALVDAMRKLAKKRETSLQKQQHAAGQAAMRKANEAPQPQGARHTPQDFSRLKHEREMQNIERMQRHQMQQEAQRRAALQQRQNPQPFQNGASQQPRNVLNQNSATPANLPPNGNRPNQLAVPGQNLPHTSMQPLPNGMGAPVPMPNGHPQMSMKGVPQAPMQGMPSMPGLPGMPGMPGLPPQHRMPVPNQAPDLRLVMQARQISEQQRQAVQMQQQGQNVQIHNSPPNMRANMNANMSANMNTNMNALNQQAFMQNNQVIMAAFNAGTMNGVSTPSPNSLNVPSGGSAGSPRMGHLNQPQQSNGSVSQITQLEAKFRAQLPAASPETINKRVRDALTAAQRQSAMHAAAGSGATTLPGMPGGMQNSPQQYAQMLRAQQERQAASGSQQPRSASAGSGAGMGTFQMFKRLLLASTNLYMWNEDAMSPSNDGLIEALDISAPKIAMKGFSLTSRLNAKPISFATPHSSKPSQSLLLGKRPRATLHDGSDDEEEGIARHEAVTGFDIREGGALRKDEAKGSGPLVIPKLKSRDFRDEIRRSRRGRNLLPPEVQSYRRGEGAISPRQDGKDVVNGDGEPQWGLTITKKTISIEKPDDEAQTLISNGAADIQTEVGSKAEVIGEQPRQKTDDEIALDALLGKNLENKGPDLIIPLSSNDDSSCNQPITEEDAYRRAIRSAPDVSTIEDYERIPVEEFGAALLRGMGWKEGNGKKGQIDRPKDVKRRQNLLGLGATELKEAEELGAWVQKSDPKRLGSGGKRGERRPRANEYRDREERKREIQDERYGGSHSSKRDDHRQRDRDRRY